MVVGLKTCGYLQKSFMAATAYNSSYCSPHCSADSFVNLEGCKLPEPTITWEGKVHIHGERAVISLRFLSHPVTEYNII